MKRKILLLSAILLFSLFFTSKDLALGQVFAVEETPSERIKAFFNDSCLGDQPVSTIQCYQVIVPDGWVSQTFFVWVDRSNETGLSWADTKNRTICFVLDPGEIKWFFTKMKKTGSFNNLGASDIEYKLHLKTIIYPNEMIDENKKPAPMLI